MRMNRTAENTGNTGNQEQAVGRADKQLIDRSHVIQCLSEIYSSMYYIDLEKNHYTELVSTDRVNAYIGSEGDAQERLNFFCHHMMTPEYTEEMLEFVNLSTLNERLKDTRIVSKQYLSTVMLSPERGNSPDWTQCSFIECDRDSEGKLQHVVFSTESIQGIKRKEIEAQKKLQDANKELTALLAAEKQHTAIIGSLSSVFFALYYIDLEENAFQEIISLDNVHHVFSEIGDARQAMKHLVNLLVAEEHGSFMRVFMDFDTIDERLGEKSILVQEFLSSTGGWNRCSIIPVERSGDGRNLKVICGFRQITAEKEALKSQDNLIQALAIPYENIYVVSPDSGEAVCYRMGKVMTERYGQKFAAGNYETNIQSYIENDVLEEDRYLFDNVRTLSAVAKLLADIKTYYFNYRVFRNNRMQYFQCQLVKPDHERNEFVVGFKNIDEEKKKELAQQRKIEEALAEVEKINARLEAESREIEAQSEIIEGIGSEYYSVLLVDPQKDTVMTYRAEDEDGRAIAEHFHRHGYCWSKGVRSYAEELLTEESRKEFLDKLSLEHIRSDGKDYSVTYEKKTNTDIIYLQARISFVREKDGGFVAVVGTRNVDDLIKKERQQEMALKAAYDAAEAANRAKTDFLSNMSHDIRTPMNGIIGMTAIAAAHLDDKERVKDSLQKITQASKHLLSLINEVLDMSRIESGKVQLMEEEFNLSDLIDNLLTMTSSQIEEHHHEFIVNIAEVVHENVIGDSLRIQKVFTNLLSNAIKFTPDGGKIQLFISEKPSYQAKVGCYEFVFEDNGIGMDESFIDKIFEPFTRASDARVNQIQGTGLGMPICRNIVRMMGGDIKVESRLGEGSRFTVAIYLKLQDGEEVHYEKFVNLPVLVADDDELSLESCCNILNELGMKAEGVSSGTEAVEQVVLKHDQNRDYFACIIDWKMPDMDGISVTREIRRKVGADVPIIIISAYDWSDIEQEARAAGANAFISKPLFRSRLAKIFQTILGEEERKESSLYFEDLESIDLTGHRALLVEDNELNTEIAVEILNMTGLTVECASDGMEAVDKITECADGYYDIIFMDIQMPKMNGYDAARAIRAMDRNYCKRIPIIAMTANAFAEDVLAAKTVGMNEHIAKPLDMKVLVKSLKKWIG